MMDAMSEPVNKKQRASCDTSTANNTCYMLVSDERLAQLSVAAFWQAHLLEYRQSPALPPGFVHMVTIPSLTVLSRCFHTEMPTSVTVVGKEHPRRHVSLIDILDATHALALTTPVVVDALTDLVYRGAIVTTDLADILNAVLTSWPTVLIDLLVEFTHESLTDELIALAEEHKQHLLSLPADATIQRFSPLYHKAVAASKVGRNASYVYRHLADCDIPEELTYDMEHCHTCHHAGVVVDEHEELSAVLARDDPDNIHCFPNVEVLILVSDEANLTSPVLDFATLYKRCPRLRLIEWTIHVSPHDRHDLPYYRRAYCSDFSNQQESKFIFYD